MAASGHAPLSADPAPMSDGGLLDMPAALAWLTERFARLPLVTVGHSVGGQLIGCMHNQARARAHVMLAASTGYWRRQRVPFRYLALLFWKLYGPLMLRRVARDVEQPLGVGRYPPARERLRAGAVVLL